MYEEIDPSGDLLIIVVPPTEPLAVWPFPDGEYSDDESDTSADDDEEMDESGDSEGSSNSEDDEMDTDTEEPEAEPLPIETEEPASAPTPEELRLKVSSKHLCLASRRFQRMLTGQWIEANTVYDDGLRHVEIEGFHPEAYRIVMNAIHGNYRQVPRQIDDLDLLAKLALVIDDLECHEAVEINFDYWISGCNAECRKFDRDLFLWIFISSVFRQAEIFERATYTAIVKGTEPIPSLGLPIRDQVLQGVNAMREYALDRTIRALHDAISDLQNGRHTCGVLACQSILLGALTVKTHSMSLLHPRPRRPFSGRSYAFLSQAVRGIETPKWYDYQGRGNYKKHYQECTIARLVDPKLDVLHKKVKGLNLLKTFPELEAMKTAA